MSLKVKMLLLVIAPLFLLICATTYIVSNIYQKSNKAQILDEEVHFFISASSFVHQLQIERGKSGLYLGGKIDIEDLKKHRELTDVELKNCELTSGGELLPNNIKNAVAEIKTNLSLIRTKIDEKKIESKESAKELSKFISLLLVEISNMSMVTSLDGYENRLLSLVNLELAKENMGKLRVYGVNVLSANAPVSISQISDIQSLKTGAVTLLGMPTLTITEGTKDGLHGIINSEEWKMPLKSIDVIFEKASEGNYGIDAQAYFKQISVAIEGVRSQIQSELNITNAQIADVYEKAMRTLRFVLVILATSLGLLVYVTLRVITRTVGAMFFVADGMTHTSEEVTKASESLKGLSSNVSSEAERTAAAIQQVVAEIEEIKANILEMTTESTNTQKYSSETVLAATEGQALVAQLSESLGSISSSNDEIVNQSEVANSEIQKMVQAISLIEQKTRVINDIVFQTKLLSFNASVEAARAGEHGKGFSVVAEEVANLSQVSGNAAQEIFEILKTSVETFNHVAMMNKEKTDSLVIKSKNIVEVGMANSQQCLNCLEKILMHAKQTQQALEVISKTNSNQLSGILEIHKAVVSLDKSSQETALAAKDTSLSAEMLAVENEKLTDLIKGLNKEIQG